MHHKIRDSGIFESVFGRKKGGMSREDFLQTADDLRKRMQKSGEDLDRVKEKMKDKDE